MADNTESINTEQILNTNSEKSSNLAENTNQSENSATDINKSESENTIASSSMNKEKTFSKEQIIKSKNYRHKRDLVDALLESRKLYSIKDVDEKIDKFLKGDVK